MILASFTIDVGLHKFGAIEDAAALIVILRFWRVLKIVEEVGVGASERAEALEERIVELEDEVRELKRR